MKEKANEKHKANSEIARVTYNKQLTSSYRLKKKLCTFLSKQAYFTSLHQGCRQSTKHIQQKNL